MVDARILYPQFRDEQEASRYPFADTATLVSIDGKLTIANDAFVDAVFFVIGAAGRLYLSSIAVTAESVKLTVGDGIKVTVATATYSITNPPTDGVVAFFDDYGRPAGYLLATADALATFAVATITTYSFARTATEFVAGVVIPANEPGVRGLLTPSGELLTGDVWLVGDQGVVLRKEPDTENVIRVDVIGIPLYKRALCEPFGDFQTKKFLRTINGCGPDDYGNFTITATGHQVADTVLRVYPKDGAIVIETASRSNL